MITDNIWHVTPINDLKDHIEETFCEQNEIKSDCQCQPKIKYDGNGIIVVHNSFDGRENFEYDSGIRNN